MLDIKKTLYFNDATHLGRIIIRCLDGLDANNEISVQDFLLKNLDCIDFDEATEIVSDRPFGRSWITIEKALIWSAAGRPHGIEYSEWEEGHYHSIY